MIRKITLSAFAAAALLLSAFSLPASAQDDATPTPTPPVCTNVGYNNCLAYPEGGLGAGLPTAVPTATSAPLATATPVVVADDATATSSDGAASIAFTGAESRVLGYVGAGMIGFGVVALAAARRRGDADQA